MSESTADTGLAPGLDMAPEAEKPSPGAVMVSPEERESQLAPDLEMAPEAPEVRNFAAWRTQNAGVEPGRAADVLRYSHAAQLPPTLVAKYFESVKHQVDGSELESRLNDSPVLQRFIAQDPILGAAAKDDLSHLSWVERNITGKWEATNAVPDVGHRTGLFVAQVGDKFYQQTVEPKWLLALHEGTAATVGAMARTREALAERRVQKEVDQGKNFEPSEFQLEHPDMLEQEARRSQEAVTQAQKDSGAAGEQAASAETAGAEAQRHLGQQSLGERIALAPFKMAPYIGGVAASGLAGGPLGVFAFNWAQNYGNDVRHFSSMLGKDGKTPLLKSEEARSLAMLTSDFAAGAMTLLDLPVVKGLPMGEALAQRITGQAIAEQLGETGIRMVGRKLVQGGVHLAAGAGLMATQRAVERAGEYAANVQHGVPDHASAVATEGLRGFVESIPDFLLMSAWGPGKALFEETGRRFNAPRESTRLKQITDAAKETLFVQKNPAGKAEEVLGGMAKDSDATTVYVTLDQWDRYWKGKGLDPREVAAGVMDDGGKGYDAADPSKPLAVPIEKYVAKLAPKGHTEALEEDVKLSQDGLTPREYVADVEQRARETAEKSPAVDAFREVFDDYRARAIAAGRGTREAEANATVVARALTRFAEREGQGRSALELYQQFPVRIIGERGQFLDTDVEPPAADLKIAAQVQAELQQLRLLTPGPQTMDEVFSLLRNHFSGQAEQAENPESRAEARRLVEYYEQQRATAAASGESGPEIAPETQERVKGIRERIRALLKEPGSRQATAAVLRQAARMREVMTPAQARQFYGSLPPDEQIGVNIPIAADLTPAQARMIEGTKDEKATAQERLRTPETLFQSGPPIASLDGAHVTLADRDRARGFVRISAPGRNGGRSFEINLKHADPSTLAHETFHVLAEVMGDLAQQAGVDPKLKADYDALLAHMGYDSHEQRQNARDAAKEERASHAWEQYLLEGKAPTAELAGVFHRFSQWLLKIYKGVQGVAEQYQGVYKQQLPEISPQVRGIFDRMLASEEEIASARQQQGGDGFTAEIKAKLPPEAQAKLEQDGAVALTDQEQQLVRGMKKAEDAHALIAKEQAKVTDEVTREVNSDPAYRALHFFQTGEVKSLDGEVLPILTEAFKNEDGSAPKLDRQIVADRYGKEVADGLPKDVVRHGGVDPDLLASAFGFGSGEEMVHALMAAEPREQVIGNEVQARMAQRYPTLLNDPQKMADAALSAVHGDKQATAIVRELRLLAEHVDQSLKARANQIDLPTLRDVARRVIAEKPVGQIVPGYFLTAERSAATQALEAMRKGKTAEAFGHRSAQLLNMFLWREARDAKATADAATKSLKSRTDNASRATLGRADPAYLNIGDAIHGALQMSDKMQPTDFVAALEALKPRLEADQVGDEFNEKVDTAKLQELLRQPRDPKKLTLDQLTNAADAMKAIQHIARDLNQVTDAGRKADLGHIAESIAAEAAGTNKDRGPERDDRSTITRLEKLKASARVFDASALRPETILRMLGETAGRIFDRYIDARNFKENLAGKELKWFEDQWDAYGKDAKDRLDERISVNDLLPPEGRRLGGPKTRRWLLMVALNMGNEGNKQRLLEGSGWTEENVKAALGKHLNKADLDFVQGIWTHNDTDLWPQIAEKEARKLGLEPEKIQASPISVPLADGSTWKGEGGYFPAKYDPRVGGAVSERQKASTGIASFYNADYRRATTAKSHTKARADSYSNVVNLNWSVYPGHIAQVLHDLAFDEFVRDTAKILNDQSVQDTLKRFASPEQAAELRTWLKVVATQQSGNVPSGAEKALGPVASWLRSRVVMTSIVGSAPVLFSQVAHPLIAAAGGELGKFSAAAALPKALIPEVRRTMLENVPELQHRANHYVQALRQRLGEVDAPTKGMLATAQRIAEHGMQAMDDHVSTAVAIAAFNDAKALKMDDAAAYKYASDKVRKIMPTHESAEMPSLLRDKGVVGSLLMAHGFQNTLYNIARSTWHSETAARATGRMIGMVLFSGIVGGLLLGHGKEEDESWGQWSLRKSLAAPFELIPFLPNLTEPMIDSLVTGTWKKSDVRAAPVLAGLQQLVRIGDFAHHVKENGVDEDAFWAGIETLLFGLKLPGRQVARTGRYLYDTATGQEQNKDLLDIPSGIIHGPESKRRSATAFDAARDAGSAITR